jgi:hypothetical protein
VQETWEKQRGCLPGDRTNVGCSVGWLTLSLTVQTFSLSFAGAAIQGTDSWIGVAPAEIEQLVDETLAVAGKAEEVGKAYDPDDAGTERALREAAQDLASQLDAWKPYI